MSFFVIFAGMTSLFIRPAKRYLTLIGTGILLLLWFSCQQQEVCEEATDSSLRIGFYTTDDGNNEVSLPVDSMSVYGLGRSDNLIYNNRKNVSRIELPLDANNEGCGFVLVFPEHTDTLMLQYSHDLNLVSVECGFVLFYTLTNATHTNHYIIRTEVIISEVTNSLDEHIKIFIPAPADDL
jgi:hypothetical protein